MGTSITTILDGIIGYYWDHHGIFWDYHHWNYWDSWDDHGIFLGILDGIIAYYIVGYYGILLLLWDYYGIIITVQSTIPFLVYAIYGTPVTPGLHHSVDTALAQVLDLHSVLLHLHGHLLAGKVNMRTINIFLVIYSDL